MYEVKRYLYKESDQYEDDLACFKDAFKNAKKIDTIDVTQENITAKIMALAIAIGKDESLIYKYFSGKRIMPLDVRKKIETALDKDGEIFFPVDEFNVMVYRLFDYIIFMAEKLDGFPPKIKNVICDNFASFEKCPMHIWEFVRIIGDKQQINEQILKASKINAYGQDLSCKIKILNMFVDLKEAIENEMNCSSSKKRQKQTYTISKKIENSIKIKFDDGKDILDILLDLIQAPLFPLYIISGKIEYWDLLLAYINLGVEEYASEQQSLVYKSS